jgi:hypothetical protein
MTNRSLYTHHDAPAWRQPPNPRVRRSMTVPRQATSVVRLLFSVMRERGIPYDTVAEASGLLRSTLKSWRTRVAPSFSTIEAAFGALGWSFVPCPRIEVLPDDIAADLARLAAKMRVELPVVWSALADIAADQAFLHERAKERIEALEATRNARRIKRHDRRRRKPWPSNDNVRRAENAA